MSGPVQPPSRRTIARLLIDGAFLTVMLVPLGLAVIILSGMKNQYADFLAQFAGPALLGAAALTAVLAVARLKHSAILGGVATLLLGIAVWPQWAPSGPRAETGAPVIRLYFSNTHVLNADVAAITASIAEAKPDVVVLTELGPETTAALDRVLLAWPNRAQVGPTIVASRWPLEPFESPADGLDASVAQVQTPLGKMTIVGAHLTRPWPFTESWGQISQTMALQARLAGHPGPKLVAGDFNSVSSARIGDQIRNDIGLHPAPGFPGTWPTEAPAVAGITIDQVYASDDLAFVSRRLGLKNGSDHRPVVVEVTRAAR
ncbi:endonuclease/exonuclease/phosphatase family protein [Brevundimonas sp. NPDC092305]|uniref:endonuclease/exonuclease/phosphatase family protein n=1 Tax=Brevundimonas sp. NPDC092305 TaxID=3363957 RepID=UPI00380BB3C7